MLAAREALHTRGLMHRDLKPSNIFLSPHGVKLLDFGLARALDVADEETRLTQPGMLPGTPHYLSPEQVLGQPAVSSASLTRTRGMKAAPTGYNAHSFVTDCWRSPRTVRNSRADRGGRHGRGVSRA